MASETIQGSFDALSSPSTTKKRPSSIPDPEKVTGHDWVAVQIGPSATGGMAVLEELRGWWEGNEYVHVQTPYRTRILINDSRNGGFIAGFDNSQWPASEAV